MSDLTVSADIDAFMSSANQAAMRANLGGITGPDLATNPRTRTITLGLRVNAGVILAGPFVANLPLHVTGTIVGWKLVASPAATVTVDVWKRNGALPAVAQSITNTGGGGVKPALAAAAYASGGVTNWTNLTVAAGDIIEANVDANDVAVQIALVLTMLED